MVLFSVLLQMQIDPGTPSSYYRNRCISFVNPKHFIYFSPQNVFQHVLLLSETDGLNKFIFFCFQNIVPRENVGKGTCELRICVKLHYIPTRIILPVSGGGERGGGGGRASKGSANQQFPKQILPNIFHQAILCVQVLLVQLGFKYLWLKHLFGKSSLASSRHASVVVKRCRDRRSCRPCCRP